ncbi:MAG TPA: hypothetical protein VGS59_08940 [Candidatus Acidoferrales bacterium]|nr:hypothetical protein [Candidatus Acidoferrales bacterium]
MNAKKTKTPKALRHCKKLAAQKPLDSIMITKPADQASSGMMK